MSDKFNIPIFDDAPERPLRSVFGELLEASKLSRIPRTPAPTPRPTTICGNCHKRLDASDDFQIKVKVCRDCLVTYAAVGDLIADYTTAKIRRSYSEGK